MRNFSQSFKNSNSNLTTPNRKNRRKNNDHIRNNSSNNKKGIFNFQRKSSPTTNRDISKGKRNRSAMRISPNNKYNNNLYVKNLITHNNNGRENSSVENSFVGNNNISLVVKNLGSNTNRIMTIDQMPQFKKSDLNIALNERNKKRQKFLDKINGVNDKDML